MAKRTILVSDLSGDEIRQGHGAKIRATFQDGRKGDLEMDATSDEATLLLEKARAVAKRGRKPGAATNGNGN